MSQSLLLTLARDSICEVLEARRIIDTEALIKEHPLLGQKMATFVTLEIDGALRGCIGSLTPNTSLIDDIIANAKAAAFEDPRFSPISTSEYLHCTLEVSVLTPSVEIDYETVEELKQKISVGQDGVILQNGTSSATFLPQVWSELTTFEAFFSALCTKASLDMNCFNTHPKIFTYQVQQAKDNPIL
jgi:AmmeMemoRadiSam system protein A